MKVLVCGGRDFADRNRLIRFMNGLDAFKPITVVIHGGASGADSLADEWAQSKGIEARCYPAQWKEHGRAAGPIRNQKMLTEERPDAVVAFAGGRGTADMVRKAKAAGVTCYEAL